MCIHFFYYISTLCKVLIFGRNQQTRIIAVADSITSRNHGNAISTDTEAVLIRFGNRTGKAQTCQFYIIRQHHLIFCGGIGIIGIGHDFRHGNLLGRLIDGIILAEGNSALTAAVDQFLCDIVEEFLTGRRILIEDILFMSAKNIADRFTVRGTNRLGKVIVFPELIVKLAVLVAFQTDIALVQGKFDGRELCGGIHISPVLGNLDLYSGTAVIFIANGIVADTVGITVDGTFSDAVLDECAILVIFIQRNAALTVQIVIFGIRKLYIVRTVTVLHGIVIGDNGSFALKEIVFLPFEGRHILLCTVGTGFAGNLEIDIGRRITVGQGFGDSNRHLTVCRCDRRLYRTACNLIAVFIHLDRMIIGIGHAVTVLFGQTFYHTGDNAALIGLVSGYGNNTVTVNDLEHIDQLAQSTGIVRILGVCRFNTL